MHMLLTGGIPATDLPDNSCFLQQAQTARDGVSTRSAPEGSLLNRVEVMEEALEAVLGAQELLIAQNQKQVADIRSLKASQARTHEQVQHMAKKGCCTIM